jgi:hypothetical protein
MARSMKRKPVREKNIDKASERKEALLSAAGLWKGRTDLPDMAAYIRELRNGDRLKRLLR